MEEYGVAISRAEPASVMGGACPVDHSFFGNESKTASVIPTIDRKLPRDPVGQAKNGAWTVRGYHAARQVLRAETEQAGFKAEKVMQTSGFMRPPILYLEGEPHREQRRQTARFFTPKATEGYYASMSAFADKVIASFQRRRHADLSDLSMDMAVAVAGEVVGLTNSLVPGMKRRIEAFFEIARHEESRGPRRWAHALTTNTGLLQFFLLDVMPAIRARRKAPKQDVISHLIESGYKPAEILTECVTYGAAGMATTREFIAVAAWHLLEEPARRAWYLEADRDARYAFLHELLRVEPVVGTIYRTAREDISVAGGVAGTTIPRGAAIRVEIYDVNTDKSIVGDEPYAVCPMRSLADDKAQPMVLGFGDGHHRCPGAYVAIQESDIFLCRLLALEGLRVERFPTVRYSEIVSGYELRDFQITLD